MLEASVSIAVSLGDETGLVIVASSRMLLAVAVVVSVSPVEGGITCAEDPIMDLVYVDPNKFYAVP